MSFRLIWIFTSLIACLNITLTSHAQSTAGVFPPNVNEGHRSWQYRGAFDPDSDQHTHRLHYQQAINDDFMWRILGQTRETANNELDPDFIQAELFWDLSNKGDRLRKGLRFDARYRFDNRPAQIGVNGILEYDLGDGWTTRSLILTAVQFNNDAPSGIFLQSRSNLFKKISPKTSLGVELFSNYGSTANFLSGFNEQGQQAGPFIVQKIGNGWSIFGGALFGLSDASPDTNLRLWITKTL